MRSSRRRRRSPAPWRVVLGALVVITLLVGLLGGASYVRDYSRYRGFAPPTHTAAIPFGKVETRFFYSPALRQQRRFLVYEPPGYGAAVARGTRFPVMYLLHPPTIGAQGFVDIAGVAVRMDQLIAARRIGPFLVVMPEGRHDGLAHDTEWANTPSGGRHEGFVLDTVRAADRQLGTIPTRGARLLAGPSMGAYAATNIALHHVTTFGGFESWSGYFTQTPTSSFTGASPALLARNSPAAYVHKLAPQLRRLPMSAFFYQGRRDRIESIPEMFQFVSRFRAAGGRATVALYPGGHTWGVWRAQLPHMLGWASAHMTLAGGG